jgi:hypothetical protein
MRVKTVKASTSFFCTHNTYSVTLFLSFSLPPSSWGPCLRSASTQTHPTPTAARAICNACTLDHWTSFGSSCRSLRPRDPVNTVPPPFDGHSPTPIVQMH